jgi:DNA-repair protein XRCC1
MSPNESKNRLNANRLKVFTSENGFLNKDICEKKIERVKIVCTQPFNKNLQFGISSIKFFSKIDSSSSSNKNDSKGSSSINAGIFALEAEKEKKEDDDFKPGSLFNKRKSINDGGSGSESDSADKSAKPPSKFG